VRCTHDLRVLENRRRAESWLAAVWDCGVLPFIAGANPKGYSFFIADTFHMCGYYTRYLPFLGHARIRLARLTWFRPHRPLLPVQTDVCDPVVAAQVASKLPASTCRID